MSTLARSIPRSLDDSARILGLSPLELASTAVIYAIVSPILKGVPFGALLSLLFAGVMGVSFLILNRTHPPSQGALVILALLRPRVLPVMPLGIERNQL